MIALTAQFLLTNLMNNAVQTPIDFPRSFPRRQPNAWCPFFGEARAGESNIETVPGA